MEEVHPCTTEGPVATTAEEKETGPGGATGPSFTAAAVSLIPSTTARTIVLEYIFYFSKKSTMVCYNGMLQKKEGSLG